MVTAFVLSSGYVGNFVQELSSNSVIPQWRSTHGSKTFSACKRCRIRSFPVMNDAKPPIDAPSGVLLLSSSVLAIAAVGCVFEITGGHPQYGFPVTAGILAVSFPGFVFLFYSAIKKGQLEALDDS